MELIILALVWIPLSLMVGSITHQNGHSSFVGFGVSLIFSPLIGLLMAIGLGKNHAALEEREIKRGAKMRCLWCSEAVYRTATVCPHCRNCPQGENQ